MLRKYPHLTEDHHLLLLDKTEEPGLCVCADKDCMSCEIILKEALFAGYIEDGIFYYGSLTNEY